MQAQIIDIPDANFKNALVNTNCVDTNDDDIFDSDVDINNNGEIEVSEAEIVLSLKVSSNNIVSLVGIENFINVENLRVHLNDLTEIDISNNSNLVKLSCYGNDLTTLDLSNNIFLTDVNCSINELESLDLTSNTLLESLGCYSNNLTSLDISSSIHVESLTCINNDLSVLDLGQNILMKTLYIGDNPLPVIDLSNFLNLEIIDIYNLGYPDTDFSIFQNLTKLYANGNEFTNLDLSQNYNLTELLVASCTMLETINIKNGSSLTAFNSNDLPSLNYVCIDNIPDELWVENLFTNSNVEVNSYCDFNYGGDFYELIGEVVYDMNNDGCDDTDINYISIRLNVLNDSYEETAFTSSSQDYSLQLLEGNSSIIASLENPDYFIVQPPSLILDFPSQDSPYVQNFCISPNGIQNDLDVIIIPLDDARPGFDTNYKIIYRNKGNTTLSGNIVLNFQDDFMDIISSNPSVNSQGLNSLTWDYLDLLPFETREINFTMNLNTPTDANFPLNGDDILEFVATITPHDSDETPNDNVFTLNQIVVNSFDPNDKRCLQGDLIREEMVGEYVHYMIRFENTGTANAINVVVKDDIDTSKYDVSTIIPLDASHDFVTRIQNTNEVEFIFENIDLPFDDANNDGYVVFKIKTLETLSVGDTFSNDAEIYFDFNFPIITNDYTTTVEENLSIEDQELNSKVKIFPNPTSDNLFITSEAHIEKASIYDINGRLLKTVVFYGNETQRTIDLQKLSLGVYVIKLSSKHGELTQKIIKE